MVSVIVPVYGSKEWLNECLESIKTKDYKDLELIIEPDTEKTGAAQTRNRGLKKASGEFVIFCDSDDLLERGAIDLLAGSLGEADMVCGSFRKFGDFDQTVSHPTEVMDMWKVAQYVMLNLLNPGKHQMFSGCWAKLFKRGKIGRFPNLTTAEDMAFNFDYLTRCNKVKFISDIVYHNRKRQGSLSTTFDEKNKAGLFGFLEGLKYVKRFLQAYYPEGEIEDALDSSKTYHSMLYFTRIHGSGRETFRRLYP